MVIVLEYDETTNYVVDPIFKKLSSLTPAIPVIQEKGYSL